MTPSGRHPFFRHAAALLVVAQAVAYALAPIAEARTTSTPEEVTHIEASHSASCVVFHRPDNCIACQLLSARTGAPRNDIAVIPAGTLAVVPCETAVRLTARAGIAQSHNSRAPPTPTA